MTERVGEFMPHEFISESQTLLIEDSIFIENDGIFQGSALGQAVTFHVFDLVQKAESPGRGDLPRKPIVGKLEAILLIADRRVFKGNRTRNFKRITRVNADEFAVFRQFDGLPDDKVLARRCLLHDTGTANQVGVRRGAAVHYRHLVGIEFDKRVVDGKPGKGGHQVLDG